MTDSLRDHAGQGLEGVAGEAIVLRVLEAAETPRGTIAAVQGRGLVPRVGLRFLADGTREAWEVRGIAFAPASTAEAGRWGLLLAPVGHERALHVGDQLVAA